MKLRVPALAVVLGLALVATVGAQAQQRAVLTVQAGSEAAFESGYVVQIPDGSTIDLRLDRSSRGETRFRIEPSDLDVASIELSSGDGSVAFELDSAGSGVIRTGRGGQTRVDMLLNLRVRYEKLGEQMTRRYPVYLTTETIELPKSHTAHKHKGKRADGPLADIRLVGAARSGPNPLTNSDEMVRLTIIGRLDQRPVR